MRIQHLTIDKLTAMLFKVLAKHQQRGFRGVFAAAEHRFAAEKLPQRRAIHAADQLILKPDLDGVGVAQIVQATPARLTSGVIRVPSSRALAQPSITSANARFMVTE